MAPIRPPTSACEDDDGKPRHHVIRFHTIAPTSPASKMANARSAGKLPRSTKPPIVFATAVPPSSGPRNSKVPTTITARAGLIARDAITVATTFAAS